VVRVIEHRLTAPRSLPEPDAAPAPEAFPAGPAPGG
jgi:hypothetical protein